MRSVAVCERGLFRGLALVRAVSASAVEVTLCAGAFDLLPDADLLPITFFLTNGIADSRPEPVAHRLWLDNVYKIPRRRNVRLRWLSYKHVVLRKEPFRTCST